jgi:DNA-binding NarL/FixJ family response regulator
MRRDKHKADERKEMIATPEKSALVKPPASTIPNRLTSVGIVEDNLGLRRSLERLLLQAPGMKCLGAWADAQSALKQLPALAPDVVLMDINLPGMNGIECTGKLRALLPNTQVVMVTVYEDTESIFKALKAGASGYLLKRASSNEILEAICDVRSGGSPMTSEIARKVVHAFREPPPDQASAAVLSAREREILELVTQGFANKEIADKLQISYNTVKVHNKNIYEKLHVRSRTEVVLKFMADKGAAGT